MLNNDVKQQIRDEFTQLNTPVTMVVFTKQGGCEYCNETRQLVEEMAAVSDLVDVEVYDLETDEAVALQYNIDKAPAIAIVRGGDVIKDYGIRYYGIPSGYEFGSLIHDVIMVSNGESGLTAETKTLIADLTTPVHFQVFVTPTCPYCPGAVQLAHQMAMESDLITADMVEAIEFPDLSNKYAVRGVPRTVVNETIHVEGMVPEAALVQKLWAELEA